MLQGPPRGESDRGYRVSLSVGQRAHPLEWIEGDVDLGLLAGADCVPATQNGIGDLVPFADHYMSCDFYSADSEGHRSRCRPVGGNRIAFAEQPGRSQRRRLGRSDQLKGQIAIQISSFLIPP